MGKIYIILILIIMIIAGVLIYKKITREQSIFEDAESLIPSPLQ
jgi:uncharacterized protein YxeA